MANYDYKMGQLESRITALESNLRNIPSKDLVEALLEKLNEQGDKIDSLTAFTNKWRGGAVVLMGLGAVLTWVIDFISGLIQKVNL
jgi:hypothetical protein